MTLELYEGCSLFTFKKQNLTLAISISSQPIYLNYFIVSKYIEKDKTVKN